MKEKKLYITKDGLKFENADEAKITKEKMNRSWIITLDNGKKLGTDEIVEFFNRANCNECPFCKECDELYERCRPITTYTFTICDVMRGNLMSRGVLGL